MPRYRRIRPVNVEELNKVMSQEEFSPAIGQKKQKKPVRRPLAKPIQRPTKTRSLSELLTGTCSNLRGACHTMRSFADDMDNLITSVESLTPVVASVVDGYTRSLKNRDRQLKEDTSEKVVKAVESKEPETEKANPNLTNAETSNSSSEKATTSTPPQLNNPPKNSGSNSTPPKMPSEEDLKQFLSNPLVKSVLQALLQSKK